MTRAFSTVALTLLCGATACSRGGCVSLLVQAPLLMHPYPTDMKYDPPLPPNDTLLLLQPGEYRYESVSSAKSWTALRVKTASGEGYVIREDGVTGACKAK